MATIGGFVNLDADKPSAGTAKLADKLATLSVMIDESDHAPTQGATEVFATLSDQVSAARATFQRLLTTDVKAFNELVRASDVPPVGA